MHVFVRYIDHTVSNNQMSVYLFSFYDFNSNEDKFIMDKYIFIFNCTDKGNKLKTVKYPENAFDRVCIIA